MFSPTLHFLAPKSKNLAIAQLLAKFPGVKLRSPEANTTVAAPVPVAKATVKQVPAAIKAAAKTLPARPVAAAAAKPQQTRPATAVAKPLPTRPATAAAKPLPTRPAAAAPLQAKGAKPLLAAATPKSAAPKPIVKKSAIDVIPDAASSNTVQEKAQAKKKAPVAAEERGSIYFTGVDRVTFVRSSSRAPWPVSIKILQSRSDFAFFSIVGSHNFSADSRENIFVAKSPESPQGILAKIVSVDTQKINDTMSPQDVVSALKSGKSLVIRLPDEALPDVVIRSISVLPSASLVTKVRFSMTLSAKTLEYLVQCHPRRVFLSGLDSETLRRFSEKTGHTVRGVFITSFNGKAAKPGVAAAMVAGGYRHVVCCGTVTNRKKCPEFVATEIISDETVGQMAAAAGDEVVVDDSLAAVEESVVVQDDGVAVADDEQQVAMHVDSGEALPEDVVLETGEQQQAGVTAPTETEAAAPPTADAVTIDESEELISSV